MKLGGKCHVNRERVQITPESFFMEIRQSGKDIFSKVQMFSMSECQNANSWYIWKSFFFLERMFCRIKLCGLSDGFIFIELRLKIFVRGQERKMPRLLSCDALTPRQAMHLSRNWLLCSYKNNNQVTYWKTHRNLRFNSNSTHVERIFAFYSGTSNLNVKGRGEIVFV